MRVLFFCNLLPRKQGSFERFLVELAARFRQGGDTVVFAFAGEPVPAVGDALRSAGACWEVIEGWSDGLRERPWRFCVPALRLLRRHRPDVAAVHFGNEMPALIVSLLAPLCGCRGVKWVWQQDQQVSDPSFLTAHLSRLRILAVRFDRFVTVYEGGRRSLISRRIPAAKVAVIHNAVADHRPIRDSGWLRKELGLGDKEILLGTVGSLLPRKRHEFLLEALRRLPADSHLLIVGDGPLGDALRGRAATMGLPDRVHWLGLRNDVREILQEVDVYVHASLAETCTYATTESMCAGKPAVLTDAGAAREQVADGVSGYVVSPDDLDGFVARVGELVAAPAMRVAMGREARLLWEKRFRVEAQASGYHALYRSLVK